MRKVITVIEKTKTGFSCYLPNCDGVVATGKDIPSVKLNMTNAVNFHVAGYIEDGEEIPEELRGDFELDFKLPE